MDSTHYNFMSEFPKVIVVINDDRSSSTVEEIRSAAKPLGRQSHPRHRCWHWKNPGCHTAPANDTEKDDIITAPKDVDPADLGNRIMEKAFQRKVQIMIRVYFVAL